MEREELLLYQDYLRGLKEFNGVYFGNLEKKPTNRSLTVLVNGFYASSTYDDKLEFLGAIEELIGTKAYVLRNELKSFRKSQPMR